MQSDLVTVQIETRAGHLYVFPDVARHTLANVTELGGWELIENIILVNVYAACLSIPKATIERVVADGEVLWRSPLT